MAIIDNVRKFKVTATWVDFEQETAVTEFYYLADMGLADDGTPLVTWHALTEAIAVILGDEAALTGMVLGSYTITDNIFITREAPSTHTGAFENAEDKAYLIFRDNEGRSFTQKIPGPIDALFMGDKETVLSTNAALVTYVDSLKLNTTYLGPVISAAGNPIQELDYGYRVRAKSRKERPGRSSAIG